MQCMRAHCFLFHDCSEFVHAVVVHLYFICFTKFWLTSYLLHLQLLLAKRVYLLQLCPGGQHGCALLHLSEVATVS